MTFLQLIESIYQIFPQPGEVQIKKDLNEIYRDFASRTRLIKTTYDETIVASTVKYALASDVDSVYMIEFLNSSNQILLNDDTLKFIIESGYITFLDYYGAQITSIPGDVATIKYYYYKIPAELSADSDIPSLPTRFHEALVHGVLERYYAKFPSIKRVYSDGSFAMVQNTDMITYHSLKYKEMIREGRKHANKMQDLTSYEILYHDF